ncbi:uncharacterized protein [Hoplias malabaricus]|uniref:uncharacterized protein n=1 Tax=Hoplias malabaricus TaxID=27720 RepID=UPI003462D68F
MMLWALLVSVVLGAGPVWAEVVSDFNECDQFFYQGIEPEGIPQDESSRKICQKYESSTYYASLYSMFHRIPLYSAYTFNPNCSSGAGFKSGYWFIEPQLSGFDEDEMMPDSANRRQVIKTNQAVNGDYSNTGYDRGHLNTNSFQCGEGRPATFTLTNSAPMDACFNRVHWKEWEKNVREILSNQTKGQGTAFLVTGTVPAADYRIPRQGVFDASYSRDFNRVTVPVYVWTAVCYKSNINKELSFSFGYLGKNQPDSRINVMTVETLNTVLSTRYNVKAVRIFKDDCFSTKPKSEEMVKKLYQKIQLPLSVRFDMSADIENMLHTAISQYTDYDQSPSKRPRVTGMTIDMSFNSLEAWFKKTENMKYVTKEACVQSQPLTGLIKGSRWPHSELRKRDTTDDSQEFTCSLVPEQVAGCDTSCLYNKEYRGYYCYSGNIKRSCSPQYSIITVKGTTCNTDHTCGTHGYDYYWCYVGDSWDYCSPPLPRGIGQGGKPCRSNHNCGTYGESHNWCYTDYDDNKEKCCSLPDRFSALNGKTCKQEHPCGYHGESYLWCYTTDGEWDYCCTASN